MKTAKNKWVQVLMIIDIHTRERIDIRVYDGCRLVVERGGQRHPGIAVILAPRHWLPTNPQMV